VAIDDLGVLGVVETQAARGLAEHRIGLPAQQRAGHGGGVEEGPVERVARQEVGGVLGQHAVLGLACGQRHPGGDLDGDVLDRADEARRLAGGVVDGGHVNARPAVDVGLDADVQRGAVAQGARAAELLDHAPAVVGGDALQPRGAVEDLAGQAEDAAQALVGVGEAAVVGDGEDADR
jgi:hypothetical protein